MSFTLRLQFHPGFVRNSMKSQPASHAASSARAKG